MPPNPTSPESAVVILARLRWLRGQRATETDPQRLAVLAARIDLMLDRLLAVSREAQQEVATRAR